MMTKENFIKAEIEKMEYLNDSDERKIVKIQRRITMRNQHLDAAKSIQTDVLAK